MQSYQVYKDSEFHKDRYPYIPPPETPLYDPDQVSLAYNERCIPKLADLLVYEKLDSKKRTDALHTLNELVSNQELKAEMIEHFIVLYASQHTVDENPETRREAALLLGSLFFLDSGRKQYDSKKENYVILQAILFDKNIKAKTAVGWAIYRLSLHKDGVNMINDSKTINKIIEAFNSFCKPDEFSLNEHFIIYLLGAFINVTMYEVGIKNCLGKKLLNSFNLILKNNNNDYSNLVSKGAYVQIKEYILSVLKNIMIIKEGKSEAIEEGLIIIIKEFLNSDLDKERLYSSAFMMSISNDIRAKKEISEYTLNGKYEILDVSSFINLIYDMHINNFEYLSYFNLFYF